jgi:hypothetical protein
MILYNLFGPLATTRMLFLKLRGYESYLIPFLIFLNYLPDVIIGIGIENKTIHTSDIELDKSIIEALRKI